MKKGILFVLLLIALITVPVARSVPVHAAPAPETVVCVKYIDGDTGCIMQRCDHCTSASHCWSELSVYFCPGDPPQSVQNDPVRVHVSATEVRVMTFKEAVCELATTTDMPLRQALIRDLGFPGNPIPGCDKVRCKGDR